MRIAIVQTRFPDERWDERLDQLAGWIDAARVERSEVVVFPEDVLRVHHGMPLAEPPTRETIDTALAAIAHAFPGISIVFGPGTDEWTAGRSETATPSPRSGEAITVIDRGRRRTVPLSRSADSGTFRFAPFAAVIDGEGPMRHPTPGIEAAWRLGFESVPFRYPPGEKGTGRVAAHGSGIGSIVVRAVGLTAVGVLRGGSLVVDPQGRVLLRAPWFEDGLFIADADADRHADADAEEAAAALRSPEDALRRALVRGLRDFVGDTGLRRVLIGLSGGIDSSVVACLAVEALGADAVTGVSLPSEYTSDESREGAAELARRLGIELLELPLGALHGAARRALPEPPVGITDENLQARLRALLLMALANQRDALVLCPGNRSEIAVGYNTLYGDTVGAVAPIGELYKSEVYRLAAEYADTIPSWVRDRAPSAELRPGQRDDQDLPAYSVLDPILIRLLDEGATREDLVASGSDPELVDRILARHRGSAYKWEQLPPTIRIREQGLPRGVIA